MAKDASINPKRLDTSIRAENDLEKTLTKILSSPIRDEKKVLEVLINAITSKLTDPDAVRQAVRQAVHNYENQLRVFMVAVANTQLKRILRLINNLDKFEEELNKDEVIAMMAPKDLIKAFALQQSSLVQSLDYVKKVADMRLELQQAAAAITSTITNTEAEEINALSGLPSLDSQQRGKVRSIVEGMIASISKDEEVLENDLAEGFLASDKSNGEIK